MVDEKMKVLAVTLARAGSKGIPSKNIKYIAGKPLLQWTIDEVRKCKLVDKYVVSTDIPAAGKLFDVDILVRPPELAKDDTPSIDALQHAVKVTQGDYDYVAMIPCTNPLKTAKDIDDAIRISKSTGSLVVGVTSAPPVERIKTLYGNVLMDTYPEPLDGQRQHLRRYYIRNGAFYIVPRTMLMEEHILFGNGVCRAFYMPRERSVNIDTGFDWKVAEYLLNDLS